MDAVTLALAKKFATKVAAGFSSVEVENKSTKVDFFIASCLFLQYIKGITKTSGPPYRKNLTTGGIL